MHMIANLGRVWGSFSTACLTAYLCNNFSVVWRGSDWRFAYSTCRSPLNPPETLVCLTNTSIHLTFLVKPPMTVNDNGATPTTTIKIVNVQEKSLLAAFFLTLLLGPLGMFYSTVVGGIVMTAVYIMVFILSIFTLGLALMLFFPAWIACIAWGMIAASNRTRMIASV